MYPSRSKTRPLVVFCSQIRYKSHGYAAHLNVFSQIVLQNKTESKLRLNQYKN